MIRAIDHFCIDAFKKNGHYLFNLDDSVNIDHIPLLSKPYKDGAFGLYDIVRYEPVSAWPAEYANTPMQVDEHVDPGLFSISLGSTAEGLELYDPSTDTWVKPANSDFVVWCGTEAHTISKGSIQAAKHRVQKSDKARITSWFEVCVYEQVPQLDSEKMKNQAIEQQKELELFMKEYSSGIPMSKSGIERETIDISKRRQLNDSSSSWCLLQ